MQQVRFASQQLSGSHTLCAQKAAEALTSRCCAHAWETIVTRRPKAAPHLLLPQPDGCSRRDRAGIVVPGRICLSVVVGAVVVLGIWLRCPALRAPQVYPEWVEEAIQEDIERGQLVKGSRLRGSPAFPTKVAPNHEAIKRGRRLVVDYCVVSRVNERRGLNRVESEPDTAAKMAVLAASGCFLPRGLTFGPTSGPEDSQEMVFVIFGRLLDKVAQVAV